MRVFLVVHCAAHPITAFISLFMMCCALPGLSYAQSDTQTAAPEVRVRIFLEARLETIPAPPDIVPPTATQAITVRVLQADPVLQLMSRGPEATTWVGVVIDAKNTDAELMVTVAVDDPKMISIPRAPIMIAPQAGAQQRMTQFGLTAKQAGTADVSITATDGEAADTAALRVVVSEAPLLRIISPKEGTIINPLRGGGTAATTRVKVVIEETDIESEVRMSLRLDDDAASVVSLPGDPIIFATTNGTTLRTTEFVLIATNMGQATIALVVWDRFMNRVEVPLRVVVEAIEGDDCSTCPQTVIVPPGSFTMGSPINEADRAADEGPQHQVRIDYAFAVGKYEVTRGQFRAFIEATGYAANSSWDNPGITQTDAHPVVNVSWYDIKAYLRWLSANTGREYRLLSEAEWEYIARADTTAPYYFGETISEEQAKFNSRDGTVAVGSYPAAAFGLHDMYGNAWEVVEDCRHDDYVHAPTNGRVWEAYCINDEVRMMRGGSWESAAEYLRAANRGRVLAVHRQNSIGFRVAQTLTVVPSPPYRLTVLEPQADTVLQLLSSGPEATTARVAVVIGATDTDARIIMTLAAEDAAVVSVPSEPIVIAPISATTRRTTQFELAARNAGATKVLITVTDGLTITTATVRAVVREPLQIVPSRDSQQDIILRLLSIGSETTRHVSLIVDAVNTTAELTMTLATEDATVVSVPSEPVVIAPTGTATQRTAQFELTALQAGTARVFVTMTDGSNTTTVAIRAIVRNPLQIINPVEGMVINPLRGGGSAATTWVQVVVEAVDTESEVTMTIVVNNAAVISTPSSLITFSAADGTIRRATYLRLSALNMGYTTMTIRATNGLNQDELQVRVVVAAIDDEGCSGCPETVIVPPGTYMMGWPNNQHQVRIDYAFAVGKYELTYGQFKAFVDETRYDARNCWKNPQRLPGFPGSIRRAYDHPVVCVKWHDGQAYTEWLSKKTQRQYRLLSEAEWEYAVRAGTTTTYYFGNTISSAQARFKPRFTHSTSTVIVGSYPANAFGLYDMHGNAAEIVEDCWHYNYNGAPVDGSAWVTDCGTGYEEFYTVRGGSRGDARGSLSSAGRGILYTNDRISTIGFRVARTLPEIPSPLDTLVVREPKADTTLRLSGGGAEATTQVFVVIDALDRDAELTVTITVEDTRLISVPSRPIILAADNGATRRTAEFTLSAKSVGHTTVTIVVTDSLMNRVELQLRVVVDVVPQVVAVPSGSFTMGSPTDEPGRQAIEGPQHQVHIGYAFAVGKYEVTRGQFRAFIEATGYDAGVHDGRGTGNWEIPKAFRNIQNDTHPVINVSWDDVDAYLRWLSASTGQKWRLLSEAEWEYAARAGTTTSYYFGETIDITQARFRPIPSLVYYTATVGSYPANAFGLHDMHGNVAEWIEDCQHNDYEGAPADGSAWVDECANKTHRMNRGGSWDDLPEFLRSASRSWHPSDNRFHAIGFRIARTLRETLSPQNPLIVREPKADTTLRLSGGGTEATTQVFAVIDALDRNAALTVTITVENPALISVPSRPIVLAANNGATRRTAEFALSANSVGHTTITIVVTDSLMNRVELQLRVVVDAVPQVVVVPPGTFTMGSPTDEPNRQAIEGPQHRVSIRDALAVGKYEVTRGQFRAFIEATGYAAGIGAASWINAPFRQTDTHPVVNVSWNDVKVYLRWLSASTGQEWRLLSEAEWEYVARARTTTAYYFGNTISHAQARFSHSTSTVIVGSYPANAFGLHDVHGNVAEWVEDCQHADYEGAPVNGSAWVDECANDTHRGIRGGSWDDQSESLRSASRSWHERDDRDPTVGFRIARTIPEPLSPQNPLIVREPKVDTTLRLSGGGAEATTQVFVVIDALDRDAALTVTITAEDSALISVPNRPIILAANNGATRRTAEFALSANSVGHTTVTIVVADSLMNRVELQLRVVVDVVPQVVVVPSGNFTMGSPTDEPGRQAREEPQHQVRIGYALAVSKYEVTRGQFRAFVEAMGHETTAETGDSVNPSWINPTISQTDLQPVINVSWDDAKAYLRWLSASTGQEWRLLSEAEWEYIARAGTTTAYYFGETIDATQARFDSTTSSSAAVGSYPANAFGVHDMHGNVWEWVEDCRHDDYENAPADGSAWLSDCTDSTQSIVRGGSWRNQSESLRSAFRHWAGRDAFSDSVGFRIARTLEP